MSEFTKGRWWIAPPMFDGDVIYAPPSKKGRRGEVVAMGIMNHADAKLIAIAPEMYRILSAIIENNINATAVAALCTYAKNLLEYVDGKEVKNLNE